jgi:hypothetical protein
MIFVQKAGKWHIISQSIDSCSLAPKFGTERLHNHTISGLPTFSSDFNQGCDPQQQWRVGNTGMIFVQKRDKWHIISQSIDSCSLDHNLVQSSFITTTNFQQ